MIYRIWYILQETGARWSRNDGNLLASATAYYAAFSFFPLLIVMLSLLGFALRFSENAQSARTELLEFVAQRSAPALAEQVASVLSEVQTGATYNGWIGLGALLLGAIGVFSQLESAFDRLWHDITPHEHGVWPAIRNALWNRLKAFLALLALGALLIAAFVTDLLLAIVRTWTEQIPEGNILWEIIQSSFAVLINMIVLALLYKLMPRMPVRWKHALAGGLLVAIVWQIGSQVLSRYIAKGNYSAYGVVGSFIVVMLWVYCASMLLYLGAQLVQVLGHPENHDDTPAGYPPGSR